MTMCHPAAEEEVALQKDPSQELDAPTAAALLELGRGAGHKKGMACIPVTCQLPFFMNRYTWTPHRALPALMPSCFGDKMSFFVRG